MNEKIENAFNEIRATESLKAKTFEAVMAKTSTKKRPNYYRYVTAFAVLFVVFLGVLYYSPVSYISVDINPSIELNINCFNRVVGVNATNNDGQEIINSVNLKNMNYIQALEKLKTSQPFQAFKDSYTEVTVVCKSEQSNIKMINTIKNCNFFATNVKCYQGNDQLRKQAGEYNLSFGKYRSYLELKQVSPEILVDEMKDLPMSEIRKMIGGSNRPFINNSQNPNNQNSQNGNAQNSNNQNSQNGNAQNPNNQNSQNGNSQSPNNFFHKKGQED